MSLGEDRVRVDFNVGGLDVVNQLKEKTARLIDIVEQIKAVAQRAGDQSEVIRLCSLAQTAYEEAAMWAVKAATAKQTSKLPDYPADHPAKGDLGSIPL